MKKFSLLSLFLMLVGLTAYAQQSLVTLPDGVTPEEYTLNITHRVYQGDNQSVEDSRKLNAYVAISGSDIYVSGLAYYFPDSYVKGTLENGKATFASGQFVGTDQYGSEYLTSFVVGEDGQGIITPFVLNYDAEAGVLTFDSGVNLSETTQSNAGGFYADVLSAVYTPGGLPPLVPVEVPQGLTMQSYLLTGTHYMYNQNDDGSLELLQEPCNLPLTVAFDGNDLYVKGLVENVPEGWAKATRNQEGSYVFPAGQYIGTVQAFNLTFHYHIATSTRFNANADWTLTYNEADGSFTSTQNLNVNSSAESPQTYYWISDVKMQKVTEKEATPATPSFTFTREKSPYGSTIWYFTDDYFVPLTDVNGEPMVADKLSFVFYREKGGDVSAVTFPKSKYYMLSADLTEIPYGFSDGLDIGLHTIYFEKLGEEELMTWTRLGLQSIYRGNGVEHRSDICWFDLAAYWQSLGVQTVTVDERHGNGAVYNLSGQRVQPGRKGLYIINGKKVVVR